MDLLGRDIRRCYGSDSQPLVVAHPLLVGILRGRQDLLYQHGELVVPNEAGVIGARYVFVPTEEAATLFRQIGYADEQMVVTGLCIEPGLVAQAMAAWEPRQRRLNGNEPLVGVFISSGAEPKEHVRQLTAAALSAVRAGGRVIVIARLHGRLERFLTDVFAAASVQLTRLLPNDPVPKATPVGLLALHGNRQQENEQTVRLFLHFDYVVCPPHERTNWALGLGLPMFAVTPAIGSFAPLNLQLLLSSGVAHELGGREAVAAFGSRLARHRAEGSLLAMARAGWGNQSIDGFSTVARWLAESYGLLRRS
jgi:hypothetical protein